VSILETADDDPRNLAENVAELLEAVPVAVIGRKAIFYRYSRRDKYAHLEF
jgi:RNA-binding protein YhbY